MSKRYDYIIVGQGLAGSALAWELISRGKTVMVFDLPKKNKASAVAAGLCNPITGKVLNKTWMANEIFPVLREFYEEAGARLNQKFFIPLPIYRPFLSEAERETWKKQKENPDMSGFIKAFHDQAFYSDFVHDPFGGIELAQSGFLRVNQWLESIRQFLKTKDCLREASFQEELVETGDEVSYGEIVAGKIIFCHGLAALESKWFRWVPLRPLKGEVIKIKTAAMPGVIFNRGAYVVPSEEECIYLAGSTYEHPPFEEGSSSQARKDLQDRVASLLKNPFEIVNQDWGIRPTVTDRRALVGMHPENKKLIIFNGLGTKGASLAPYLSKRLADWMEGLGELPGEVNISRFKALYSS